MNRHRKFFKCPERRLVGKTFSGGFTIIETLIAMLLFAIALAGGIAVYFNACQIKTMAVHKKIAAEYASSSMEELRRRGYTAFAADYTGSDPTVTPFTFEGGAPPPFGNITLKQEITYDDLPAGANVPSDLNFREVTVDISWTEANRASVRHIVLTSYVDP